MQLKPQDHPDYNEMSWSITHYIDEIRIPKHITLDVLRNIGQEVLNSEIHAIKQFNNNHAWFQTPYHIPNRLHHNYVGMLLNELLQFYLIPNPHIREKYPTISSLDDYMKLAVFIDTQPIWGELLPKDPITHNIINVNGHVTMNKAMILKLIKALQPGPTPKRLTTDYIFPLRVYATEQRFENWDTLPVYYPQRITL